MLDKVWVTSNISGRITMSPDNRNKARQKLYKTMDKILHNMEQATPAQQKLGKHKRNEKRLSEAKARLRDLGGYYMN